ncbi:MAG TPA: hydroxyisourate hydrolase [Trebonia sp.]|jgi:5-hydroxyisourate hydrolase
MTVSTHVLDATLGTPAAGVPVSLAMAAVSGDDGWLAVESGVTGADGRHVFGARTEPGVYRLVFGTGGYFAARGVAAFYPEVTITFTVAEGHYHVPLLLSPFAYSTYRGS